MVKVPPWQCPSSAPVPPEVAPGGSGQLGTPRKRPTHWAPSHYLWCSSEPLPKSPISLRLTIQARATAASTTLSSSLPSGSPPATRCRSPTASASCAPSTPTASATNDPTPALTLTLILTLTPTLTPALTPTLTLTLTRQRRPRLPRVQAGVGRVLAREPRQQLVDYNGQLLPQSFHFGKAQKTLFDARRVTQGQGGGGVGFAAHPHI